MATGNTKKKTSSSRGSSVKKSTAKKRTTTSTQPPKQQDSFRNEVILWVVLAFSIILFLANFGLGGNIGNQLSSFFFGVFGFIAYIFPICFFIGTVFVLSNRENKIATVKLVASVLFVVFACLFVQLITDTQKDMSVLDAFAASAKNKSGGGFIGGALENLLYPNFGAIGTYVIDIVFLIISIVLITERSAMKGLKRGSTVIYKSAKDDMSRRKEIYEQRKEERALLQEQKRMDMRVSGVAMDTKIVPPEDSAFSDESDEISEIRYENTEQMPMVERDEPVYHDSSVNSVDSVNTSESKAVTPIASTRTFTVVEPQQTTEQLQSGGFEDFHKLFEMPVIHTGEATREVTTQQEGMMVKETGMEYQVMNTVTPSATVGTADDIPFVEIPVVSEEIPAVDGETENPLSNGDFTEAEEATSLGGVIELEELEALGIGTEPDVSEVPQSRTKVAKSSEEEISAGIEDTVCAATELEAVKQEVEYQFPPIDLLSPGNKNAKGDSKGFLQETAMKLQQTLKTFGVNVTITNVSCGPAVTRYELQPEMGVKVSKIVGLADDIKLNLAATDIRIEAPIPGKAAIGIEVPNKESTAVMFRDLIESEEFQKHTSPIAFAAGKDIGGQVIVTDIAKMPHLLIAGATGSGKSVCINTIIMSILYRAHPDDVKLIMIDPKVVELSVYNGIPHLFIPVVTDPKKAAGALHWAVSEMMERYDKFAAYGVRDLKGYNAKVEGIKDIDDPEKPKKLPQIVIIVDELADLMMVAPGDVEDAICRLAQLARAAGIHLIIATQRPSVNVITGLIKANMPSRIAFSVTSGVDSRTILDMVGAEKLLGKGDMLFYPQGMQKPLRVQGAFVSDKEVSDVVDFLKNQSGDVTYSQEIESKMNSINTSSSGGGSSDGAPGDDRDAYFVDAAKLLIDKDKGSIGMLQRYFKVGFNRAARIMDQLEEAGVVGPDEGTKPRQVLMSPEQLEVYIEENL